MKTEDVPEELIYAYAGEPEITATEAHFIASGLARVLSIVEREQHVALDARADAAYERGIADTRADITQRAAEYRRGYSDARAERSYNP